MASIINSDDGVISGTAGLKSTGANDGALNIQTNGSNAISISSGQRSTFPTTIGVGGATPSTSGSGVTFPATASASSDANTLDDYEEGTWSPIITDGTNDATMDGGRNTGGYTKIGNLVTVCGYIGTTSLGSVSGSISMKGLPFTVASGNSNYSSCALGHGENLAISANQVVCGFVGVNSTIFYLQLWDTAAGTTSMQASEWSSDGTIIFNITYRAA